MQTTITPIENGEAWQVQVNFVDPDAAQLIEIAGQVANVATEAKNEAETAAGVSVENANAAIAAKAVVETLAGQVVLDKNEAVSAKNIAVEKAAEAIQSAQEVASGGDTINRINHKNVYEQFARKQNANWEYLGSILTVGSSGTYSTITAAINAAVSGDIIQLNDGEYLTSLESGGYLLINNTKRLLIRGNPLNRSAVVINQNAAASFGVRIRTCNQVTFKDLTITCDQSNSPLYIDLSTSGSPVTAVFNNCIIDKTDSGSNPTIRITATANNNYLEFWKCKIQANNNATSTPFFRIAVTNAQSTTYTSPLFISKCVIIGQLSTGDSSSELIVYDSYVVSYKATPYIVSIGTDVGPPTNTLSRTDIRGCTLQSTVAPYGHNVLLGRGSNNVYFANNTILVPSSVNVLDLGLVIKSIASNVGDVIIEGNYIQAPRPTYIKGAKRNIIRDNTSVSNWSDDAFGFGLEINNPNNSDGPIESIENVVTNNVLVGKVGGLGFTTAAGAQSAGSSAKKSTFSNNRYYVKKGNIYINNDGVTYTFVQHLNFWDQDFGDVIKKLYIPKSDDTASSISTTYSQDEVQSIVAELRDLKTKMRIAGLLES